MIDCKKIFIDTAPFIYYLEKNPGYFDKARGMFMDCLNNEIKMVTSTITIEEYCVYPYMKNNQRLINNFEEFLDNIGIEIVDIGKIVAKRAAKIRAEYVKFKSMDALQISTAIVNGCDLFVTNDKQLRQFREIKCVTLDDIGD